MQPDTLPDTTWQKKMHESIEIHSAAAAAGRVRSQSVSGAGSGNAGGAVAATEAATTALNNTSFLDTTGSEVSPFGEQKDDGWRKAFDKGTGAFYFYNRLTRQTSWTNPFAGVGSSRGGELATSAPSMMAIPEMEKASVVVGGRRHHEATPKKAAAPANDANDAAAGGVGGGHTGVGDTGANVPLRDEDVAPPTPGEKAAVLRLNLLRIGSMVRNFEDASPMYSVSAQNSTGSLFPDLAEDFDQDGVEEYSEKGGGGYSSDAGSTTPLSSKPSSPMFSSRSRQSSARLSSRLSSPRPTSMSAFGAIEPPDREYEDALTKQLTAANASGGRYELEIALQSATELVSHHLLVDFEVAFLRSLSVARGKLKSLITQNVVAGEPPECVLAHAQASAAAKARADERRAVREAKRVRALEMQKEEVEVRQAESIEEDVLGTEVTAAAAAADMTTLLTSRTSAAAAAAAGEPKKNNAKVLGSEVQGNAASVKGHEAEDDVDDDIGDEDDETPEGISELPSLSVQKLNRGCGIAAKPGHQRTETAPGLMGGQKTKSKRNSLWSRIGHSADTSVAIKTKSKHAKRGSLMPNFFRKKSASVASPSKGGMSSAQHLNLAPAAPSSS